MARNDRTVRLEVVKRALAESRRGVLLKSLAEKHGWNLRTLYRDIEALQAAHFPIVEEEGGRYRLDGKVTTFSGAPAPTSASPSTSRANKPPGWKHTSLGRALDTLWNRVSATGGQAALFPVESVPWIATRAFAAIDDNQHRRIVETIERATRERSSSLPAIAPPRPASSPTARSNPASSTGLPLRHHDPMSDAEACARIVLAAMRGTRSPRVMQ